MHSTRMRSLALRAFAFVLAGTIPAAAEKPSRSSIDPPEEVAAADAAWREAAIAARLARVAGLPDPAPDASAGADEAGFPTGAAAGGTEDFSGAYPAGYWRVDPLDPPAATVDCVPTGERGDAFFYTLRPDSARAGLVGVRVLGWRENPGPELPGRVAPDASLEISPASGGDLDRVVRFGPAFDACAWVRVQFVFEDARSARNPQDALVRVVFSNRADASLVPLSGGFPAAPPSVRVVSRDGAQTPAGFLRNISTRGRVGLGAEVLIAGVIVEGTEPKNVLVRGLGPTLAAFGVADALPDPTLRLFQGSTELAFNDDWRTAPNVDRFAPSGPPNDREPAIYMQLAPGEYTAILEGKGIVGNGLIEAYDEDEYVDPATAQLRNISTRGRVGTGDSVMIAGVIVRGTEPKQVLIRALGPTLTGFGVPDVLANPTLRLVRGQTEIGFNDDWRANENAATIEGTGLAPANDAEPALLVTLDPGEYTAIVAGAGETSGNALVEVYGRDAVPFPGAVNSPLEGEVFADRVVTVSGTITAPDVDGVLVNVNGREQTIPVVDGAFSSPAILTSGDNTITVTPIARPGSGGASRTLTELARKILNVFCSAPPTEVWAQLTWGDPTSDVDLYCFQPNGQTVFFGNERPSGGGFLDVDDTEGFGPEHYQIASANGDVATPGEYHIRIHYYDADENMSSADGRVIVYKNEEPFASVPFSFAMGCDDPSAAGTYNPGSCSWQHIATVVVDDCGNTDFTMVAGQKYGYDEVTGKAAGLDYKSVKQGDSDTITMTSNATTENPKFLTSSEVGIATVDPPQTTVSPQTLTVTGVSPGVSRIDARRQSGVGEICDAVATAVYAERALTVAVIPVHLAGVAAPSAGTAEEIQTYLNSTVYNQGIVSWTVTVLPAVELDYDLNDDGKIDSYGWDLPEQRAVIAGAKNDAYDANVFLVAGPLRPTLYGVMNFNQRYGFVHPDSSPAPRTTIAHELGHGTFGLIHGTGMGVANNLMTQGPQVKWRLFKGQWDMLR